MLILVTGAGGKVGRHVVAGLCAAGHRVRALSRRPERLVLPEGAEGVAGDLARPESLRAAFRGVEAVHLITAHEAPGAAAEVARMARAAGVRRATVMTGGGDEHMLEAVRRAGLEWVHLNPWEFMSNLVLFGWPEAIRAEGVVREPYAGFRSALVHEADIADVAAAALVEPGHAGRRYDITGPEALTRARAAEIIGAALGRPVRFEELTRAQALRSWMSQGVDEESARWLLDVRADGEGMDLVLPTVEQVTGRPARTLARWAAENIEAFR